MQRVGGGIKAAVGGDRTFEPLAQIGVGALGDEAAALEDVVEVLGHGRRVTGYGETAVGVGGGVTACVRVGLPGTWRRLPWRIRGPAGRAPPGAVVVGSSGRHP